MKIFYSASIGGFLNSDVYRELPDDAVGITEDEYSALLDGQAKGKRISSDASGAPVLVDPPVDTSRERYARDIATRRYHAETGGITVNGIAVATDDRSKTLILGAALEVLIDDSYSVQFKAGGGFVTLTGPEITQFARAIRAHVQACFDREAELLAALNAGVFSESMLDQGWPA